jgi:hypothetical protein
MSRRVGCGASWHPVTAARLRLPSSALRRSYSGANRAAMRPRAGCFTVGQLLPHLSALLGRPVPSLTEASRRLAASVDRCQGRCAATMPRQELGDVASRSASTSSFLADTACGPSSLQLPSPRRVGAMCWHAHARRVALSSSLPRRRRTDKTPSASSPRKSPAVVHFVARLRPRVRTRAVRARSSACRHPGPSRRSWCSQL